MLNINYFFHYIFLKFSRFLKQLHLYGFFIAFWSFVYPFYRIFGPLKPYFAINKHKAILKYLSRHYLNIPEHFSQNYNIYNTSIDPLSTLWVSWWDGEETMPPIVKMCYKSIIKHAGKHPVQLITKENYRNFISIPDYILDRVNCGNMKITHFSNIIRANLLYEYGGIWMDATILTLKDISFDDIPFFTLKAPAPKNNGVTMSCFAGISSLHRPYHYNKNSPKISRWSGFLLAGKKGSVVFEYMREILYAYWKDHNDQIDYVLYDYTIALGYDNIPEMKRMIDNVPCNEIEKFVLEKNLNNEYNEDAFSFYKQTTFHKLTWKDKFNTHTKDNKQTIYGHLLENN